MRFLESRRQRFGIEPICRALGVPPSTYYARRSRKPSARAERDALLVEQIEHARRGRRRVYGARKTYKQLRRDGVTDVGRERVARVMRREGLRGTTRGRAPRTTTADATAAAAREDLVERDFTASRRDQLWVGDITYVRTYSGFVYLAFVLDVYSRKIVGWQLASTLHTRLVLDALEMAWALRRPAAGGLVAHTDRGSQYTSIAYTERVADYGIVPSVGSRGDAYDNAMAEAWVSTYKAECVQKRLYPSFEHAEQDALDYIGFYNNERLHEALGDIPPTEHEANSQQSTVSPVAPRRQATPRASRDDHHQERDQKKTRPAVDDDDGQHLPWTDTPGNEGTN